VRPSMGSVGDAYDNAMCESFFATLECELLARCRLRTQTEARNAVFAFIEGFYNRRRRHSSQYSGLSVRATGRMQLSRYRPPRRRGPHPLRGCCREASG
jgi:hypothetical protein